MSSRHLYQSIALTSAISGLPFFCHLLLRTIFISGFSPLREVIPHPRFRSLKMSGAKSDDGINNYIDKLALICINSNRKQLVARSVGKSVYFTPGGKREPGETDDEALRRECMEELSVNLSTLTNTTASIEPYGIFQAHAYGKPPGTIVRMACFRVVPREAELELEHLMKASAEVEELKWIDSSFDRNKLTITGVMILDDLKENGLID
ncbi:hypothetical protein ACHAW6_001490 [Cyclotella cf. meneghiniana]